MKRYIYFLLITIGTVPTILHAQVMNKDSAGLYLTNVQMVARVTGEPVKTETIPSPNNTLLYNVGGTDLGIMWDMGEGRIGLFFGDTCGKNRPPEGGNGGDWRSNVLAFSNDSILEDGITFSSVVLDSLGNAREVVLCPKDLSGEGEYSSIPTGAIRANGVDYVHYMSIRKWNVPPKDWETNYSSMYSSSDGGENWKRCYDVNFKSLSNFGQVCYAKKDGYIYMIGTQSGRSGAPYLARFFEKDILDQWQYEFWNETRGWVKGEEWAATPIFEAPVGEASLLYHEKYKCWIITYVERKPDVIASCRALMYRYTEDITGPWSEKREIASQDDYPGLYCAYMHPLKNSDDELYFCMSLWDVYNVFLMKADLKWK